MTGTPPTEPNTPELLETEEQQRQQATGPAGRPVGRLRPHQFNVFHNLNQNKNCSSAVSTTSNSSSSSATSVGRGRKSPRRQPRRQQSQQQQQQESPPSHQQSSTTSSRSTNNGRPSSQSHSQPQNTTTTSNNNKSNNPIPDSHVNIIVSAYGKDADIYRDILQIPRDMVSERDVRIAYFRRGRQVLAEKPASSGQVVINGNGNGHGNNNVSQWAKLRFQAVSMAYEILSNPVWKESYHQSGLFGPGPGPGTHNQNNSNTTATTTTTEAEEETERNLVNQLRGKKPPKKPILSHTPSTLPAPSNNRARMDADNASLSTAGTGTSSVLRKAGTFLEKLQHKRLAGGNHNGSDGAGNWNANNNTTATTVRWNEEVEELIFRQDPEEISFKSRAVVDEEEFCEDEEDCNDNDGGDGGGDNNGDHAVQREDVMADNSNSHGRYQDHVVGAASPSSSSSPPPPSSYSSSYAHPQQEQPPQSQHQQHQQQYAYNNVQNNYAYNRDNRSNQAITTTINTTTVMPQPNQNNNDRTTAPLAGTGKPKKRVVLDTAELGSHLDKLDKVADSIAGIFDELEASFDGLLGLGHGGHNGKPTPTTLEGGGPQQQQQQQPYHDNVSTLSAPNQETLSACDTDMAAAISFAETATVGTSISLLDPQKHSQTALKPAAATSTIAKAQRKRLRNVQRRRQQQQQQLQAQQQQQQQQEEMHGTSEGAAGDYYGSNEVQQRNNNNMSNPSSDDYEKPSDRNKKNKKKNQGAGEDAYFESLYQNFFALPKERLPSEMTIRTRPARSECSVSTISHSVATAPDSAVVNLDGIWPSAWPVLGGDDEDGMSEKERRTKYNQDILARVDSVLAQRSSNGADYSFDSSFPESFGLNTTMDSGTSYDSTAVDTACTSTVGHPDQTMSAVDGCNTDPKDFLAHVFDVPLEAPLEFWCGEVDNCAASTDASMRHRKKLLKERRKKQLNNPAYARKESNTSNDESTSIAASSVRETEEESGPQTDESVSLMDPPTHDSRIYHAPACDDSTLASLNTNRQEGVEEDGVEQENEEGQMDEQEEEAYNADQEFEEKDQGEDIAENQSNVSNQDRWNSSPTPEDDAIEKKRDSVPPSPRHQEVQSTHVEEGLAHDEDEEGEVEYEELSDDEKYNDDHLEEPYDDQAGNDEQHSQIVDDVEVESASASQFMHFHSPSIDDARPGIVEVESASVATEIFADINDAREDISCVTMDVLTVNKQEYRFVSNAGKDDASSAVDLSPAPSSFSSRGRAYGGLDSAATTWDDHEYKDGDYAEAASVATSVSSVVSRSKANDTSFINYLATYLKKAMEVDSEISSLACIKANLSYGLESWRAANNACMDAIIITEEDMTGMLDILECEMKRTSPEDTHATSD